MDGRGSQEPHGVETVIPAWFPPVNNGGHIPIQGLPFFWTKAQTQCVNKKAHSLYPFIYSLFNRYLISTCSLPALGQELGIELRAKLGPAYCPGEVCHWRGRTLLSLRLGTKSGRSGMVQVWGLPWTDFYSHLSVSWPKWNISSSSNPYTCNICMNLYLQAPSS